VDPFETASKLAFELFNAGRHDEAEALCRTLLPQKPQDVQLLFLLGMILHKTGRNDEAVSCLVRAAMAAPPQARVFNGLGCAYQSLKDWPRAADSFAKAIELDPRTGSAHYSLGNVCFQLGDIERAAASFRKAVELDPRDAPSWNNLGKCLLELRRPDDSIAAYDRALALDGGYAMAHYGRAISLLTAGRLQEGFREYEWRWEKLGRRELPQPAWNGEAAGGKTLFLHAEQGFGDAIQAARFVSVARERVARVILECRPELKSLFTWSGCADVVIAYGEPLPPFDCYTSLISLGGVLGVTLETVPRRTPYLKAPKSGLLPAAPAGRLKVGLVWAGNPGHHNDAARSLRLEDLTPVLQTPGVAFYSLQVPVPARDKACLESGAGMVEVGGRLKDFLDTASAVAEMDLIICVDTAVAHLAGALGKPVWTLLPFASDWRWFLDRTDTVWYPTMRLFRQSQRGEWQPVIQQVAEALRSLASSLPGLLGRTHSDG
jgi:tetratricopeptide (TPR) repeat protein